LILKVEVDWPFKDFIYTLLKDLFNTKWEIRHGAATAIREVIKHHGHGAGKASNLPSDQVYKKYIYNLFYNGIILYFVIYP